MFGVGGRIVIVAPHPDDEVLGCGGLMYEVLEMRQEEIVLEVLGVTGEPAAWKTQEDVRYEYMGLAACSLPLGCYPGLVDEMRKKLRTADFVFSPFIGDLHTDHEIVARAVRAACKPHRNATTRLMEYEVPSETGIGIQPFAPTSYLAMGPRHLEFKIEAIERYTDQIGHHPFPRSPETVRALAMVRGSECDCEYAEAYRLVREIW